MSADVGTLLWLAPEVMSLPNKGLGGFRKTVYGKSADVFSFGIVLFEVMTRQLPYVDMPEVSVLTTPSVTFKAKVMAGLRPRVPPFHGFPGFFMELGRLGAVIGAAVGQTDERLAKLTAEVDRGNRARARAFSNGGSGDDIGDSDGAPETPDDALDSIAGADITLFLGRISHALL